MTSTFFDVPLSRLTHVLVALLAITALGAPGRGYAQDSDDERAHTHFTAGRSYFEEGNYEQALAEFQHAYELSHRDVLLVNVANCQERLGQWARRRADARHVSRVDGAGRGGARLDGAPHPGAARPRRSARRRRGRADRVGAGHGRHDAAPPTTPAASGASDGLLVPAIVAFAVGGAAAIAWGVLGGLALAEQSSVSSGCGATRSCTPGQVSTLSGLATGADVSMSIALVGIAAGVVLILVDPPHGASPGADASAGLRVTPWASASSAGLSVGGTL